MKNQLERLLDIAKRLDDMAEDGPSELLSLSEEIGKIVESLEDAPIPEMRKSDVPEWLRQMQHLVEREAINIVAERYRHQAGYNNTVTIQLPPSREEERLRRETLDYFRLSAPRMNAAEVLKSLNGI